MTSFINLVKGSCVLVLFVHALVWAESLPPQAQSQKAIIAQNTLYLADGIGSPPGQNASLVSVRLNHPDIPETIPLGTGLSAAYTPLPFCWDIVGNDLFFIRILPGDVYGPYPGCIRISLAKSESSKTGGFSAPYKQEMVGGVSVHSSLN